MAAGAIQRRPGLHLVPTGGSRTGIIKCKQDERVNSPCCCDTTRPFNIVMCQSIFSKWLRFTFKTVVAGSVNIFECLHTDANTRLILLTAYYSRDEISHNHHVATILTVKLKFVIDICLNFRSIALFNLVIFNKRRLNKILK